MSELILRPRVSEKAYGMSKDGRYVFIVPRSASKQSVASAVASQFGVTVENVNVSTTAGKVKRSFKKGGRFVKGQRSDIRKAYVTLKSGDQIPIFAAVEEAEKEAAKEAKKEKK